MRTLALAALLVALVCTLAATAVSAATGWSIVPSANKVVRHGNLSAVSCVSATLCEAVGGASSAQGTNIAVGERWNGTAWTNERLPLPAGGTNPALEGIACPSSSFCVAVGTYQRNGFNRTLAERWNGTAWSVLASPNVASSTSDSFAAVSCATTTACVAVGSYESGALAAAWNGFVWSLQTPAAGAVLAGVSCPLAAFCMADGYTDTGSGVTPLAMSFDGSTWTLSPTPIPPGASNTYLFAISCAGAAACIGVGRSDFGALIQSWNGTAWSISPNPSPSANSALVSVSCATASSCLAIGSNFNGTVNVAFSELLSGGAWTLKPARNPAGAVAVLLNGVSCTAPASCLAVGDWSSGAFYVNLSETWNGTSWTRQGPFGFSGQLDSALLGVACASATSCVAVGGTNRYQGAVGVQGTMLAETWNGTSWSATVTPAPAGTHIGVLSAVACPSALTCMAVGGFTPPTAVTRTLAEQWNGSTWTVEGPPNPAGATSAALGGVACPSTTQCIAVGSYSTDGFATQLPLAESWNGTTWTRVGIPSPSGSSQNRLTAIACASGSRCVAVGYSDGNPLAEGWNGASWSVSTVPAPAGATFAQLNGVACPTAAACKAVGTWADGNAQMALAETWNGSSWSVDVTPNPSSSLFSELNGVSCASSSQCKAVGDYDNGTAAESWDGVAWTLDSTPNPAGAAGVLNAVACPSAIACVAAGHFFGNLDSTLVEDWTA